MWYLVIFHVMETLLSQLIGYFENGFQFVIYESNNPGNVMGNQYLCHFFQKMLNLRKDQREYF